LRESISRSKIQLTLAEGQVDPDLMMTYGKRARKFAQSYSKEARNVILSVRNIFFKEGPAGLEQQSLEIKQEATDTALSKGAKIIFVADYKKISDPYSLGKPLLYSSNGKWQSMLENNNVFIVTTRHPDAPPSSTISPPQSPSNEKEWYCYHAVMLHRIMNKGKKQRRFIEISDVPH